MSRKGDKEKPSFEFLPIVQNCLELLLKSETTERDITACAMEFNKEMEKAQKFLTGTPGLDVTEEEQRRKIKDLEQAIAQKEALLAQCQELFKSWQMEG